MSNALTFAGNLVLRPMSTVMPRNAQLWAFGAPGGRFEGNTKYLFLWMSLNPSPASPVWITTSRALARDLRQRGLNACHRLSWRGMATAARAGLYVVNDNSSDVNFSLGGGAKVFNLWHGVGLKNVLFGASVGSSARLKESASAFSKIRNMRRFERPNWALSTSPEMAQKFFARCFDIPASRSPALGYPRLDPMVDGQLKRLGCSFGDYSALDKSPGITRTLVYLPTLRLNRGDHLSAALPDLRRLSAALEQQNAELLLKIHPKMQVDPASLGPLPHNIRLLPSELDIYPVLDRFDALITDYSSLFFDYISFRSSGVVLYTYDFEEYTATERDLAWDYDEVTIGNRARDFATLCDMIGDGRVFAKLDPGRLALLRRRFWGDETTSATASEKIVASAQRLMLDQPAGAPGGISGSPDIAARHHPARDEDVDRAETDDRRLSPGEAANAVGTALLRRPEPAATPDSLVDAGTRDFAEEVESSPRTGRKTGAVRRSIRSVRKSLGFVRRTGKFLFVQRILGFPLPDAPGLDGATLGRFNDELARAGSYLEFGSGGTTKLADRLGVNSITVESDRFFAKTLKAGLTGESVTVLTPNIGITERWGRPLFKRRTARRLKRWRSYVDLPFANLRHFPDLILVDGRFRVACTLEAARQAHLRGRAATLILDDYAERPKYWVVERWLGKPERVGRSAVFKIGAAKVPAVVCDDPA